MSRLASGLWVQAYLRRLYLEHIPAYVAAKGDPTAGAVIVKTTTPDGQAIARQRSYDPLADRRVWVVLAAGAESEVDATLARQRIIDTDLWIVEVETRDGRDLLDQPGLSE